MRRAALAGAVAALVLPAAAQAQALRCAVPGTVPAPRADLPDASQPRRVVPIGSYTLALTWGPEHCRTNWRDASASFQCRSGNSFGFTLHGLWPDGVGREWPQYCGGAQLLGRQTIRRNLCATPSVQLLQHEWAKHGTCMPGETPDGYFAKARRLYDPIRYPNMDALSRRPLTVGQFARAMAKANPQLGTSMMRITTKRGGWLDEVWLCLDTKFRYRACPAHQRGAPATASLRIWRGRR
jgi:ribonuclease T2